MTEINWKSEVMGNMDIEDKITQLKEKLSDLAFEFASGDNRNKYQFIVRLIVSVLTSYFTALFLVRVLKV